MNATKEKRLSRMGDEASTTGALPSKLANSVSEAMHEAIQAGMEPDEVACVAASVVGDYGRVYYGDDYLPYLGKVIMGRADLPAPQREEE